MEGIISCIAIPNIIGAIVYVLSIWLIDNSFEIGTMIVYFLSGIVFMLAQLGTSVIIEKKEELSPKEVCKAMLIGTIIYPILLLFIGLGVVIDILDLSELQTLFVYMVSLMFSAFSGIIHISELLSLKRKEDEKWRKEHGYED